MIQEQNNNYENSKQNNMYKWVFMEQCSICYDKKERGTSLIDQLRFPDICYECWFSHVKSYIQRINYKAGDDIISPINNGDPIPIISYLNSLKTEDIIIIEEMVFKKYTAFTPDIEKCPSQSCDFVYIDPKCRWGSDTQNCPKCQIPLNPNSSFSLTTLIASFYLMMSNKCPKCDIPIQKISGCPHMTCPCGHHFCWYCYKDHPSGPPQRVYQLHNVPQCIFIFFSKIVLVITGIISLMVAYYGNWIIRAITSFLKVIISVGSRGLLLDGFILIQILIFFSPRRRPSYQMKKKYYTVSLLINLFALCILYWLEQIQFFFQILFGQLIIGGVGFAIGYFIVFSVQTWFQLIA